MRTQKTLLLIFSFMSFTGWGFAQADCSLNAAYFCDDFEAYDESQPLGPQSMEWTTWSGMEGGAEDGDVSTGQAASGSQSLYIEGTNPMGGPQDVLLLLGNQTSGRYRLQFKLYIPDGYAGYYNIQKTESAGQEFAFQLDFTADGAVMIDAGVGGDAQDTYPHDQWMVIDQIIDLDNDWTTLSIDGRPFHAWPYSNTAFGTGGLGSLGGVDFFPLDDTYRFYIDDVFIEAQPACSIDAESIICDDFEGYGNETVPGPSSSFWTTWSGTEGGAEEGELSTEQSNSGSTSMLIAEGQTQDALLLLGNKREGAYTIEWMQYVPTGLTGYYNIQDEEEPGVQWNLDVYFNLGGNAPGIATIEQTSKSFPYPEGTWFKVRHFIDLDADALALLIDDDIVEGNLPYSGNIGAIDFFSIDNNNRYFVDDVLFKEGVDCDAIDAITATGSATGSTGNDDGSAIVEVMGGFGAYTYEWSNGENTPQINDLAPGEYTVTVSPAANIGGCLQEVTVTVTVDDLSSTQSPQIVEDLRIAPNPTTGLTFIQLDLQKSAEVDLEIRNLAGQQVIAPRNQYSMQPSFEVDLSDQASGIYLARLTVDGAVIVKRIVLQH
jgi:hypothetical protein